MTNANVKNVKKCNTIADTVIGNKDNKRPFQLDIEKVRVVCRTAWCGCMIISSPVHTSNNVEATFDFVAKNGNNVERVVRKISSFRQSRNKLNMWWQLATRLLKSCGTLGLRRVIQYDESRAGAPPNRIAINVTRAARSWLAFVLRPTLAIYKSLPD